MNTSGSINRLLHYPVGTPLTELLPGRVRPTALLIGPTAIEKRLIQKMIV